MRYSTVPKKTILGVDSVALNSPVQIKSGCNRHSGILIYCGKVFNISTLNPMLHGSNDNNTFNCTSFFGLVQLSY